MSLGKDLGMPPDPYLYQPDDRLVLPFCRLGLEFEFEKVRRDLPYAESWTQYWQAKADRSLHDAGMEYVFGQPLFGKDAVVAIEGLCGWAKSNGLAASIRTGLHVHHDIRDMLKEQLDRECGGLYPLFEKAIYNYVGNNREENVFCMPWYTSLGATQAVRRILASGSGDMMKQASAAIADEKYAGLNLDTLVRFGSLEWRHALVTKESREVIQWVNIILRFKEAAMRLTYTPLEMVRLVKKHGARWLAREAFKDQFPLLDYPEFEQDVLEYGIPTVLELATSKRVFNPNMDWAAASMRGTAAATGGKSFAAWADRLKGKKGSPKPILEAAAQIPEPTTLEDVNMEQFTRAMEDIRRAQELRAARVVRRPPPALDDGLATWVLDDGTTGTMAAVPPPPATRRR